MEAAGLIEALEPLHRLALGLQALERIEDANEKRCDHCRDLVAELPSLGALSHADRAHRTQLNAVGVDAVLPEIAPQSSGQDRQHEIVDCASERALRPTYLMKREL